MMMFLILRLPGDPASPLNSVANIQMAKDAKAMEDVGDGSGNKLRSSSIWLLGAAGGCWVAAGFLLAFFWI
jgi:hypothetical protein